MLNTFFTLSIWPRVHPCPSPGPRFPLVPRREFEVNKKSHVKFCFLTMLLRRFYIANSVFYIVKLLRLTPYTARPPMAQVPIQLAEVKRSRCGKFRWTTQCRGRSLFRCGMVIDFYILFFRIVKGGKGHPFKLRRYVNTAIPRDEPSPSGGGTLYDSKE